jgi:hypothetical protein
MSSNKMGGVPEKTRTALYKFFDQLEESDDAGWAKVIRKMTKLGHKEAAKRLKRK